jgi:hypothetical protein
MQMQELLLPEASGVLLTTGNLADVTKEAYIYIYIYIVIHIHIHTYTYVYRLWAQVQQCLGSEVADIAMHMVVYDYIVSVPIYIYIYILFTLEYLVMHAYNYNYAYLLTSRAVRYNYNYNMFIVGIYVHIYILCVLCMHRVITIISVRESGGSTVSGSLGRA